MKRLKSHGAALVTMVGVFAVLGAGPVHAQTDPAIGTWKLNLTKSTYSPGPPAKSQTVTIAAAGMGLKISVTGVDATGQLTKAGYTILPDGKDVPVTGNVDWDMTSWKRVDASTSEQTRKRAGKVIQTAKRVISADGKTMTTTSTGTNAKGEKINNVLVYDRQ
jgi:hypothetical protein